MHVLLEVICWKWKHDGEPTFPRNSKEWLKCDIIVCFSLHLSLSVSLSLTCTCAHMRKHTRVLHPCLPWANTYSLPPSLPHTNTHTGLYHYRYVDLRLAHEHNDLTIPLLMPHSWNCGWGWNDVLWVHREDVPISLVTVKGHSLCATPRHTLEQGYSKAVIKGSLRDKTVAPG